MASLFADLAPEARQALADGVQWSSLSAGETLFTQGDPGDSAYLLVSGRLLVSSEQTDGSSQVVGEVGPGELVGEYALIMDRARSATVLAKKDADLVVWSGSPLSILSRCEQTWIDGRKYFDRADDQQQRLKAQQMRAVLIQKILNSGETMLAPGEAKTPESELWPRDDIFCDHGHHQL